jgi:hypothetical protein
MKPCFCMKSQSVSLCIEMDRIKFQDVCAVRNSNAVSKINTDTAVRTVFHILIWPLKTLQMLAYIRITASESFSHCSHYIEVRFSENTAIS